MCGKCLGPMASGVRREQDGARRMHVIGITCFNQVTTEVQSSLSRGDVEDQANPSASLGCGNPRQLVSDASDYFGLHFRAPIQMQDLAQSLGTSLRCLNFSFDRIRGVTPLQALQDHRLNQLFAILTEQPRQGLNWAIRACGLGETSGVPDLFEQEFGIDMPLFLHISCRAADDRAFRLEHPEDKALVLPF
jgi:AraC-like DNA-binding protein